MSPYPLTMEQRSDLRRARIAVAVSAARRDAMGLVSSHKCSTGHHAAQEGGCANDGTGCLCQCHDPVSAP